MKPMVAAFTAHVDALCKRHQIGVQYKPGRAFAWLDKHERRLRCPPIKTERSYALALHELGHLLGKWQTRKSDLEAEAGAWLWAEQNALRWTELMKTTMRRCLQSYLDDARMRQQPMPEAGHAFWRLLG